MISTHQPWFRRFVGFYLLIILFQGKATALEGYYTEETVREPAQGQRGDYIFIRKTWYAGDRMRKDEEWKGITIARFDKNVFYVLDPKTETYFEITPAMFRKYSEFGMRSFGALEDKSGKLYFPDDLLIRTETSKTIGNWECYQVMTNPRYRSPDRPYVVIWYSYAVDFPSQIYAAQMKKFFNSAPEIESLFRQIQSFEGYPVRTESHGISALVVNTLYKIEWRADLDPSLFELPTEYQKVTVPER